MSSKNTNKSSGFHEKRTPTHESRPTCLKKFEKVNFLSRVQLTNYLSSIYCHEEECVFNQSTLWIVLPIPIPTLRLNVCFHSRLFPQFFGISHKSPWKRLEKKIRQNNCLSTRQNKHESWRTAFWSHNARRKEIFSTSGPTPRTKRAYGFVFKRKCSRTAEFVQLHK